MRIGETWWDYWLPLWCWFQGAAIKHVSDYVALHLDHPIVSSEKVQDYGLRFLRLLEAEANRLRTGRCAEFHKYCDYRIGAEKRRLAITTEDSRDFVEKILNPTVWAAFQDLLHRNELTIVEKTDPHHRILARTIIGTARAAEARKARPATLIRTVETVPASYWRLIGVSGAKHGSGASLVGHLRLLEQRWPYRADLWISNAVRRVTGKPTKVKPPAANAGEAVEQILRLRRHVLWRLFVWVDGTCRRLRWTVRDNRPQT
jgi:hypothetical protein